MTYCNVAKSTLSGTVQCPSSKSYTHRAIFLASLAYKKGSTITNILRSEDTDATINACKKLGAVFDLSADTIHVTNTIPILCAKSNNKNQDYAEKRSSDDAIVIDAKNSGTTIRIASSIAALLDTCVTLTGDASLKTRPMQPLLDALSDMGATYKSADNGRPPLEICGPPISGGEVKISGNVSSQFITSLFLCAPLTKYGIRLTITDGMVSKPYLDATTGVMREFGITVNTQIPYKKYHIAPQRILPANFTVPFDASSLALLLAASTLNEGKVVIKAQMGVLPQGDELFIDMLESMGVRIEISDSSVNFEDGDHDNENNYNHEKKLPSETIRVYTNGNALRGGKFDLSNNPDLLPPLAIMALKCNSSVEIYNVEHARLKETDRIGILARELPKIGIQVTEHKDGMILDGPVATPTAAPTDVTQLMPQKKGAADAIILNSENDHRLFMALCIAGMCVGNCIVSDSDSVAVSYPEFIKDIKSLGAKISIESHTAF